MKPHKHAELIKAWADGVTIQVAAKTHKGGDEGWFDCNFYIDWNTDDQYRIKPEPKPYDFGVFFIAKRDTHGYSILPTWKGANLKLVWNGETGELKSAEVLK